MKCGEITSKHLKTRIAIRRRTLVAGSFGAYTETTTDHNVWAWVRAVSGTERIFAERVTPGERYRVVVRFRGDANGNPFWTIDDRVIIRTKEWAIESVIDMDDEGRWIEMRCVENRST